jgi:hypothetical protein
VVNKKRSRKEFESYLKAMLKQDYPKVKYQTPERWVEMNSKEK